MTESDNIIKNVKIYENKAEDKILQTLYDIGLTIESRAVGYAPADTGHLRGTSFTIKNKKELAVEVGFAADYAAIVHEMKVKHAGKPRPHGRGAYWDNGKPQYLKDAFEELIPAVKSVFKNVSV